MFVFHEQVALANVFDRGRLAFDAGFFVFAQVLVDNLFDAIRHGGAKEGALGIGGDFPEDGFHVFHEAHVEHFIRFVEDDSLDRSERNRTALDMVNQTARGGNNDACLALEGAQLDCNILTAIDRNNSHVRHLDGVLLDGIRNLDGEFACRREHEHGRFTSVEVDARKERERECCRLACTGLCCSEKICSLQKRRDGLSLNGRGRFVTGELDGFENFRRETEIVESHQRFVADIFFVCRLFIYVCRASRSDCCFISGCVMPGLNGHLLFSIACHFVIVDKFDFFAFFDLGICAGFQNFAVIINDDAVWICGKECGFVCLVFVCAACDGVQERIRFELQFRVIIIFRNVDFRAARNIFCHKSPSGSVNFICSTCRVITLLESSIQ